jgi:hypothetical protein
VLAVKFAVLTSIAGFVCWLAMEGMVLLDQKFEHLQSNVVDGHDSINDFLTLRSQLQRLLVINGIIIGLSTLSAGAMREALKSVTGIEPIPKEYVLVYGTYFSSMLALAYFPAYIRSVQAGEKILEFHYPLEKIPLPKTGDDHDVLWYEQRHHLRAFLEIDPATSLNIIRSFSIFSPVIGSIIGIS